MSAGGKELLRKVRYNENPLKEDIIYISDVTQIKKEETRTADIHEMEIAFDIDNNGPILDATYDTFCAPLYSNSNNPSEASSPNIRSPITSCYDNSTTLELPLYDTFGATNKMTRPNITMSNDSSGQSVHFPQLPISSSTIIESADENHYHTPGGMVSFIIPSSSTIPAKSEILHNFENWMASMDGGCHTNEICMKAKLVVENILDMVEITEIMNPDLICKHFTDEQLRKELTAFITSLYIRYYASFLLYMRERYSTLYSLDAYSNIVQRIERYVPY